jgi:hypothetical protein
VVLCAARLDGDPKAFQSEANCDECGVQVVTTRTTEHYSAPSCVVAIFKCLLVVTLLTLGAHDAEHPSHLLVSTLH